MKSYYILLFIIFLSCVNHEKKKDEEKQLKRTLSPISSWLIENEDTLFRYVKGVFNESNAKEQSAFQSREMVFEGGIPGILNEKIHEHSNCIKVFYVFRSNDSLIGILLTPEFDSTCAKAIDSIFSDIDSLKHFKIDKYRAPSVLFSKYITEKDTVDQSDIFFSIIPVGKKFDLITYTRKKLDKETEGTLIKDIFGEEVIVKRINVVSFKIYQDDIDDLKSIKEARELFKIIEQQ